MATVYVECWKCDQCAHRWIKTEVWPDQCGKCRSRKWNASAPKPAAVPVAKPVVPDKPAVKMNDAMAAFMSKQPVVAPVSAPEQVEDDRPPCRVCDSSMRLVKGKWACCDPSCGQYGIEQR